MVQAFQPAFHQLGWKFGEVAALPQMNDFVNQRKTAFVPMTSRGELPHLQKPGGTYFVTFRLFDAVVPASERAAPGEGDPWSSVERYEPPITLGSGALRKPAVAQLVQSALRHFDGSRYWLLAWCVMPNHVHAVVTPYLGWTLSQVLQSWKGYTAREANRILQRSGPFWERESFDHLIRSLPSLEKFVDYVRMNPVAAGLCERADDWAYSGTALVVPEQAGKPAPQ